MQHSYGDINRQQENQRYYHHQFIKNDDCCPSIFPVSNPPQNLNHHSFQQQHTITHHHLFQNQHQQPHFRPFQPHLNHHHPQSTVTHPQFFPEKFKLALDTNKQQATTDFLNGVPHSWDPHQDSASIKEPFWKQLNRSNCGENEEQEIDEGSNNKRCKDLENKYRQFGELEAIYSHAKVGDNTNYQTGSSSALTGENSPTRNAAAAAALSLPFTAIHAQNTANNTSNQGSENSIGEESSLRKTQKRLRRRKMKEKWTVMAGFFENLVKQVIDHQEMLHKKFLEVIERMDKERKEKEETWRQKEAEKHKREAISRAHEQALASSREAEIVSYVEKITGQSINLPARKTPLLLPQEISEEPAKDSHNRWPKDEVEVLIQVRSSIESKFQEPGLKGPLWEEVSCLMCSMGYQRSAKRCKEKWENINKYFRKTKESRKRRSQESKTCSYFNQLDQLYSRTVIDSSALISNNNNNNSEINGIEKQGYSELLDAFITGSGANNPLTLESEEKEKEEEHGNGNEDDDGRDEIGMVI